MCHTRPMPGSARESTTADLDADRESTAGNPGGMAPEPKPSSSAARLHDPSGGAARLHDPSGSPGSASGTRPAPAPAAARRRRWPPRTRRCPSNHPAVLVAGLFCAYLAASIGIWWHVWSGHPTSTYLCACGDPGQYLWFFWAPAQAMLHGHSPFFTGADYHPGGVNLLDNPGVLGLAITAAPVTWVFGPVASVNTVLTLTPAFSALAAYLLLRRWVRWWPSAALGGLFYGFSPLVVASLQYVHLQVAFLVLPPLIVLCLDELLVRQQRAPIRVGLVLALLIAAQFMVSPEMLVITALSAAIGVVLLGSFTAWKRPEVYHRHLPRALRGAVVAVSGAGVLLAYPLWFALAGPRHTVGAPWSFIARTGNALSEFFLVGGAAYHQAPAPILFGYTGQPGPGTGFLGLSVVAALLVGVVALRRDGLVRLAGALGAILAVLSLGTVLVTTSPAVLTHGPSSSATSWWLPWSLLAHVPLVDEASPSRISEAIDLLVAVIGAVALDRLVAVMAGRWHPGSGARVQGDGSGSEAQGAGIDDLRQPASPGARGRHRDSGAQQRPASAGAETARGLGSSENAPRPFRRLRRLLDDHLAGIFGLVVAGAVLFPVGLAYRLPLVTQPVTTPRWYSTVARHLPSKSVVLALPWGLSETSVWQAVNGAPAVMAGGDAFVPGPGGHVVDKPRSTSVDGILTDLSIFSRPPAATPGSLRTVRQAMGRWGVTTVVIAAVTAPPTAAVAFMTATLGRPPVHGGGVWAWYDVSRAPPPLAVSPAAVQRCQAATFRPTSAARCVYDTATAGARHISR